MAAEVVSLKPPAGVHSVQHTSDEVPAFFASVVAQTDAENHELERKFHEKNLSFSEQINVLDGQILPLTQEANRRQLEWQGFDAQATHVPFIGKLLFCAVMLGAICGEWLLAATALDGLQLEDWETYVTAFGVVGTGVLLTKGIGVNLRWMACNALRQSPIRWFELALLVTALCALLAMLVGMSEARVGYAQADLSSGGAGLSDVTTQGLALLQGALYLAQVVIFWYVTAPNVVADRARRNYVLAKRKLTRLHAQRARVAATMNRNVNRLHAEWATNVHQARQMMAHYLRELHIRGRSFEPGVCTEFREDWFVPVPTRVAAVVDPMPEVVQLSITGSRSAMSTH